MGNTNTQRQYDEMPEQEPIGSIEGATDRFFLLEEPPGNSLRAATKFNIDNDIDPKKSAKVMGAARVTQPEPKLFLDDNDIVNKRTLPEKIGVTDEKDPETARKEWEAVWTKEPNVAAQVNGVLDEAGRAKQVPKDAIPGFAQPKEPYYHHNRGEVLWREQWSSELDAGPTPMSNPKSPLANALSAFAENDPTKPDSTTPPPPNRAHAPNTQSGRRWRRPGPGAADLSA